MNLSFRTLDMACVPWEKMGTFQDRTIFQTREWLNFITATQGTRPVFAEIFDNSSSVGYFTGMVVRKMGLKILGSPMPGWTTSYMGFNLPDGFPRHLALKPLSQYAFDELGCIHMELMDRQIALDDIREMGLAHRMLSTFQLDLTQDEKTIYNNMSRSACRYVRVAQKLGVHAEQVPFTDETFAEEFYEQLKDVFAKQLLTPTYGLDRVRELIRHVGHTDNLLLLRIKDDEGHCIATGIFPGFGNLASGWGGASWRQYQKLHPNELMFWTVIQYWKNRGSKIFDFGGGGEYKRQYGGISISVPWMRISKYKILENMRNAARQLVRAKQVFLGRLNRQKAQPKNVPSPSETTPTSHMAEDTEDNATNL